MTRWQTIKGFVFRRRHKLLGAIDLLCEVHTANHYDIGFYVKMGATPDQFMLQSMYVDAWRTLRQAVKRRTD